MKSLTSMLYRAVLRTERRRGLMGRVGKHLFRQLRKSVVRLGDPRCVMDLHGRSLAMPLSHQLPSFQAAFPLYDSVLRRVTRWIRGRDGYLCGIDVGANIGDTICACAEADSDRFLAIEPSPKYFPFLEENVASLPGTVRVFRGLCSGADKEGNYRVESERGTARVVEDAGGEVSSSRTLDSLVLEFPEFADCNFLKIDTDGYDFGVVRGGKTMIRAALPCLHVEIDVFENKDFVADATELFTGAFESGYDTVIVYDNLGHLIRVFERADKETFQFLLLYQMTGLRGYYDMLFLKDGAEFARAELAFVATLAQGARQTAAVELAAVLAP